MKKLHYCAAFKLLQKKDTPPAGFYCDKILLK